MAIAVALAVSLLAQLLESGSEAMAADPKSQPRPVIDLVILALAPGSYSSRQIEQNFRDAGAPDYCEELEVEQISAARYELYKLVITAPEQFSYGSDFTPDLEYDGENSNIWVVHQRDPHSKLAGIHVKYTVGGEKKEKTEFFATKDALEVDARFKLEKGKEGKYVFRSNPEPEWQLISYHLAHASNSADPAALAADAKFIPWPKRQRKYVIRLRGFTGGDEGQTKMFQNLKASVDKFQLTGIRSGLFSFADFREVIPKVTAGWDGEIYTIRCSPLGGKESQIPQKAWALFPLTKKQVEIAISELSKIDPTSKDMAEKLNKRDQAGGGLQYPVIAASGVQATTLDYSPQPFWFEILPPLGQEPTAGFMRSFAVKDAAAWRNHFKREPAYALLAYEGVLWRNGLPIKSEPRIIRVTTGAELWEATQLQDWNEGLEDLVGR